MKRLKSIVLISLILAASSSLVAQRSASRNAPSLRESIDAMKNGMDSLSFGEYSDRAASDYRRESDEMKRRYKAFRDSVMADYVKALRGKWKEEKPKPAAPKPIDRSVGPEVNPKISPSTDPAPKIDPEVKIIPKEKVEPSPKDEPEVEPKVEPKVEPTPQKPREKVDATTVGKIKVKKVVDIPNIDANVQPKPFVPIVIPEDIVKPSDFAFTYFGTTDKVNIDEANRFKLTSANNSGVAKAIETIAGSEVYNTLLQQCLDLRSKRQLCDWAYYQMLQELSAQYLGRDTNEATLLTGYLFCMSGYKTRYAYNNTGKLYTLLACDQYIVDIPYIPLQSDNYTRYYVIGAPKGGVSVKVCDYAMPQEKAMSLYVRNEPLFDYAHTDLRMTLHSYPSIKLEYSVNRNLLNFYNTYPTPLTEGDSYSKWGYYAQAPMGAKVKETVYPTIREAIEGKGEVAAVNIIMDFIESYKYGYDDKIWGYDRAFFPDETIYYPYSDCEDHAILLSRMVRDILGLETALIYYPGHLAAAVRFNEPFNGDYVEADGKRFTVCDPTIYYAGAGRTMRKMNNAEATVIVMK